MKLIPATREFTVLAAVNLLFALVALAVGFATEDAADVAIGVSLGAVFFGAVMWLIQYRPLARRATEDVPAPPAGEPATVAAAGETLRRTLPRALGFALVVPLAFVSATVAGIAIGNAAALYAVVARWRGWERRTGRTLLRRGRGYVAAA